MRFKTELSESYVIVTNHTYPELEAAASKTLALYGLTLQPYGNPICPESAKKQLTTEDVSFLNDLSELLRRNPRIEPWAKKADYFNTLWKTYRESVDSSHSPDLHAAMTHASRIVYLSVTLHKFTGHTGSSAFALAASDAAYLAELHSQYKDACVFLCSGLQIIRWFYANNSLENRDKLDCPIHADFLAWCITSLSRLERRIGNHQRCAQLLSILGSLDLFECQHFRTNLCPSWNDTHKQVRYKADIKSREAGAVTLLSRHANPYYFDAHLQEGLSTKLCQPICNE